MKSGVVKVNGQVIRQLGTSVNPEEDVVEVLGKRVNPETRIRYIVVHKPRGYVCTRARHAKEKTVYDLVPNSRDLVIAGRLDKESEGLVLLTNDGALVQQLTHPSYQHEKEYEVVTAQRITDAHIAKLLRGVPLKEGLAKADKVQRISEKKIRLVLHQGWKRQIRRMCEVIGLSVLRLKRIRMGSLKLDTLELGASRGVKRDDFLS